MLQESMIQTSFLQGHFLEELSTVALTDGWRQHRPEEGWTHGSFFVCLRASVSPGLGTQAQESQM